MKKLLLIFGFLLCAASASAQAQWSMGYYYPTSGVSPPLSAIQWTALTDVVMVGGNSQSDGSVTLTSGFSTYAPALITAAHAHGVKALLYLGGPGWAGAASSTYLSTFITNIMSTVNTYGFDGVDLDWEDTFNQTELTNLASGLRTALGTKVLTATSVNGPSCGTSSQSWTGIFPYIDRMNMVTVDGNGTWEAETWFSDPLYSPGSPSPMLSIDSDVSAVTACGYPLAKVGIQIPFYGYLTSPSNGPYQPFGVSPSMTQLGYNAMLATYGLSSYTYDTTAHLAWRALNSTSWIAWDTPRSITDKINYVKAKGLGGWDIWVIGGDYTSGANPQMPLLNAVNNAMPGGPGAPVASFSPTSVSFPNTVVTITSSPVTVTLTNSGSATMTGIGISITGTNAADFSQTNTCSSSLLALASCTISVTFTPSTTGSRSANISVADNAAGSPQTVALSGTGVSSAPATVSGNVFMRQVMPNASSTGTTINTLTKITGNPSTLVKAATTDTSGVLGVTVSGAGTTGNATIQLEGQIPCVFDGATTSGDYVQISSTTAGDCHDAGATFPTSNQVIGRVESTNGSAGTYTINLYPAEINATAGSGGSVTTVFGRSGTVIAVPNDYTCAQVANCGIRDIGTTFGETTGTALASGSVVYFPTDFACTISRWTMSIWPADTATIDVWKIASSGTAVPTVSNSITASALPAISTGTLLRSTTLTGWTTSVAAHDEFAFKLNAVGGTATFVSVVMECDQ